MLLYLKSGAGAAFADKRLWSRKHGKGRRALRRPAFQFQLSPCVLAVFTCRIYWAGAGAGVAAGSGVAVGAGVTVEGSTTAGAGAGTGAEPAGAGGA